MCNRTPQSRCEAQANSHVAGAAFLAGDSSRCRRRLGGWGALSDHGETFGETVFGAMYLKSLSKCAERLHLSPTPAALSPRPQSKPMTS